jgi:hypothetical protein
MAWITPLADTVSGSSWERIHLPITGHGWGLLVLALFACCFVLAFGPALLAVLRLTERRIDRWVEQDAPRPVVPTAAGHDDGESP